MKKISSIMVLFLFVTFPGCPEIREGKIFPRPSEVEESTPVKVLEVKLETFVQTMNLVGTIQAKREVVITAEISGKVIRLFADEGDKVSRGQLIVRLDDENIKLQIMQARARVKEIEANLEDSRKNLERFEKLFAAQNISKTALEREQLKVQVQAAQLSSAKANLEILKKKQRDTKIISPISGSIAKLDIEVGEFIANGTPVVTIVDISEMEIGVGVPQMDVVYVKKGKVVEVYPQAFPGQKFNGYVTSVGVKANFRTLTFDTKVSIENPDERLKPGMAANVVMEGKVYENAILIPQEAVVERFGEKVVFVVVDDQAFEKAVVTEGVSKGRVLISSGLKSGDKIVVVGQKGLRNKSKVKVLGE